MEDGQSIGVHQLKDCLWSCLYIHIYITNQNHYQTGNISLITRGKSFSYLLSAPPRWFTHSTNRLWSSWFHLILVLVFEIIARDWIEFLWLIGMTPRGVSWGCFSEWIQELVLLNWRKKNTYKLFMFQQSDDWFYNATKFCELTRRFWYSSKLTYCCVWFIAASSSVEFSRGV